MFPEQIVYIGVLTSLTLTFFYIRTILYGKTRPNLISWSIWALAPLVAVFLQIKAGAGLSFLSSFMSGFGPLLVVIVALIYKKGFWKVTKLDIICGVLALLALVIYIITNKFGISIIFAILSDGLAAIPTVRKSWEFPESESAISYLSGIISNTLALLVIKNWSFSIYSFSAYLIIMNIIIIFSIYHKKIFNLIKK
ncbi:MAG: hypothetical protein WC241_03215 [Candidatus Paceibacterota bacterium]|jgi:hypothetical protein